MRSFFILASLVAFHFARSDLGSTSKTLSWDFDAPFDDDSSCGYLFIPGNFTQISVTNIRASNIIDGSLGGLGHHGNYLSHSGSEGVLEKENIRLSGKYCLSFDYHIFGEGSSLEISGSEKEIFFYRNSYSSMVDGWQHNENTFEVRPKMFSVRLIFKKYVSVDNLNFIEGSCPEEDV